MLVAARLALLLCLTAGTSLAHGQSTAPAPAPGETVTALSESAEPTGRSWGLAVGLGFRLDQPVGDSEASASRAKVVVRFMRKRAGFVPAIRLGLTPERTTLIDARAASDTPIGSVSMHPFMAGVGWRQPIAARTSLSLAGTVGYSWNDVDTENDGSGTPQLAVPARVAKVANSAVWELSGQVWFDVNSRISLMTSAAFWQTRPQIQFADGTTRRWRADQVRLQAGIAFTVLKPGRASRRPS
jgi:hypothetical protein